MDQDEKPKQEIHTGGGAYIGGDLYVNGHFTGRDSLGELPPLDPHSPDAAEARALYLSLLRKQYNVVETHAFTAFAEDERVGKPQRLPLLGAEGVYIPLHFDAPTEREAPAGKAEAPGEAVEIGQAPLSLTEVLQKPGHLAIIGDAGSGKTTVLHVLVSALAAEDPTLLEPELAAALPEPRPLPILLPLRLFEQACCKAQQGNGYTHCVADLLRFVDDSFRQWCPGAEALPPRYLARCIRSGQAWFLLDALDEVADAGDRETVRNIIHALAAQLDTTRLIVTARVAAYRSSSLDDRFTTVTVRDLDEAQRKQMVHAIYRGLALPDAGRRAEELDRRFETTAALRELGRTPVMVWTAAVIHALRGELPEGRAALYDAYVDILLKQSFKRTRYDAASVDPLADDADWPLADRRHYLTYTAFQIHRLLERQPGRQGDRRALVGEDELVDEVLAPYFQEHLLLPARQARERARAYLSLMVERSGLLYEAEGGYTIGDHLTMQEFLAAWYVAENYAAEDPAGYEAFVREKAGHSWWREVFLLAAGYLAGKPGFQAPKFLQRVAEQGTTPEGDLAARTLAAEGLVQLRALRRRPNWYEGLAQTFANKLYDRLYAQPSPAPVALRQAAGLALGWLYGMPGEGTIPDPRFAGPLGLPDFVRIPAGPFWMGEDESPEEDERPRHRVTLGAYEVARYPTTNAMFARFVAGGGYGQDEWWEEAIAEGYWKEGQIKNWIDEQWYDRPQYWDDARWNNPSQPVVGVTWYEAAAYCRWLTAKLDDGHTYRLPTEAEWERAARGPQGRRYPWGEAWEGGRCNSKEAALERSSPVGLFPAGAAAGPIHDMAGNVWEWCGDWYGPDYYASPEGATNPTGPEKGKMRVLRGGSWYSEGPKACRCGYRVRGNPWLWNADRGFRCVRTLSS